MVGRTISHYKIVEEVGRGGMGIVYRAEDTKLERTVAIKVLPPHALANVEDNLRFYREARTAAAITHPNIAVTHAIDEAIPSGSSENAEVRPFIAMEFIEGETLSAVIERGVISIEDVIDITIQIAQGLKAAHEKGIIHRDIKSGNIMINQDGLVKILDFGLAQRNHSQKLTQLGAAIGTAAYMSPEQSNGEELDHRTDLWSLGVILYELLTGSNPFKAHYDQAVIYAILNMNPDPVSGVRTDVPRELEDVISKLLEKNSSERCASAQEVIDDLRAIERQRSHYAGGSGERQITSGAMVSSTDASHVSAPEKPNVPVSFSLSKGKHIGIAASILAVIAIVFAISSLDGSGDIAPVVEGNQRVAIFPFFVRGSAESERLSTGMVDLLSTKLDGAGNWRTIDPGKIISSVGTSVASNIDPDDARSDAISLGANLFVTGSVVETAGVVSISARLYRIGESVDAIGTGSAEGSEDKIFELVDEVASELLSAEDNSLSARVTRIAGVTTNSIEAFKAYLDGEAAYRSTDYLTAAEGYERATELDSTFALAWYRLAKTAEWLIRARMAHQAAENAVKYYDRLSDRDKTLLDAMLATKKGDMDLAVSLYRTHLQTYPGDAEARISLGEVLFHDGPFRGIRVADSLPIWNEILENNPDNLAALIHVVRIQVAEGQDADALMQIDRLLNMIPEGDRNPELLLFKATLTGSEEDLARAAAVVRDLDENILAEVGWLIMAFIEPSQNLDFFWETVLDPAQTSEVRLRGFVLRVQDHLRRGLIDPAQAQLALLEDVSETESLVYETLIALLPLIRESSDALVKLRDRIIAWTPPTAPLTLNPISFYSAHDGMYPIIKTFLLGWIELELENFDAMEEYAVSLEILDDSFLDNPIADELATSLRARSAYAQGDMDAALRHFDEAKPTAWYQLRIDSPFYSGSHDRYLKAQILEQKERYDEALLLYDSFQHSSGWDQVYFAPGQLGRARIFVRQNRHVEANEALEDFFSYWDEVDELFGPLYEEARALQANLDLAH